MVGSIERRDVQFAESDLTTLPYIHVSQVLAPAELGRLYAEIDGMEARPGFVRYRGVPPHNICNRISWLVRPEWQWLYDRLLAIAAQVNSRHWRIDISATSSDELQFTRYEAGEHYGWHRDVDPQAVGRQHALRTLTAISLLRSPSGGGGLEFRNGGVIPLAAGDMVVFPSVEEHRALEVSQGTRDSLILWLSGRR